MINKIDGLLSATEKLGDSFTVDEINVIAHRINFVKKNLSHNSIIIDVGAGDGILPSMIANQDNYYFAVDLVPDNITNLSSVDHVHPILSDAHSLPFKDNYADYIIAMAMVYYLDFPKFLCEARRVLKPNGILIFCTSNPEVITFCPANGSNRYFNINELHNLLLNNNFDPIFYGSFQSIIKSQFLLFFFVSVKNVVKLLLSHRFTKNIWYFFRSKYYGEKYLLTKDLILNIIKSRILSDEIKIINLSSNSFHRVIYCKATARKLS
jgi:ubiquinone/menaquinone biosynthesis C-methylase UbiE